MKSKRILAFGSSLVLSLSSLFVFAPSAHAATRTWDGSAGDGLFSTDANWSGDTEPVDGDDVVFDNTALSASGTVNNDIPGLELNSITFQGSTAFGFSLTGQAIDLVAGIVNTTDDFHLISLDIGLTANQAFDIDAGTIRINGVVSGAFNLTKTGAGRLTLGGANTFSGTVTASAGEIVVADPAGLGTSGAGTTIDDGAQLEFYLSDGDETATISEPLTLNVGTYNTDEAVVTSDTNCDGETCEDTHITLTGNLSIAEDTFFDGDGTLELAGAIAGNFNVSVATGSYLSLKVASVSNSSATDNGTYEAEAATTEYEDSSPSESIYVGKNETAVVTGEYGDTQVGGFGILKGTGTVGALLVESEGTLAPGMSPGCLSSGDLTLNGTYQVEIAGTKACDDYDQTDVTGSVDVTDGTLDVSLLDDFEPKEGAKFVIINNDDDDAVTGTFSDLDEGSTFEVNDVVFKISYEGGDDGNDVVLTVQEVPGTPDTGFELLTANPLLTMAATTVLAGSMALLARRYAYAKARK